MKKGILCWLLLCLTAACQRNEMTHTVQPLRGMLSHYSGNTRGIQGVFLAEVLETQKGGNGEGMAATGLLVKARVLSDSFVPKVYFDENLAVPVVSRGTVAWFNSGGGVSAEIGCLGRDRPVGVGDRLLLFPGVSQPPWETPDGQPTITAGQGGHYMCVDEKDIVHIENHDEMGGAVEVADVPLAEFGAFLNFAWTTPEREIKRAMAERCGAAACGDSTGCLGGAACGSLQFLSSEFIGLAMDGRSAEDVRAARPAGELPAAEGP